jgi:hypothetical protein
MWCPSLKKPFQFLKRRFLNYLLHKIFKSYPSCVHFIKTFPYCVHTFLYGSLLFTLLLCCQKALLLHCASTPTSCSKNVLLDQNCTKEAYLPFCSYFYLSVNFCFSARWRLLSAFDPRTVQGDGVQGRLFAAFEDGFSD